MDDLWVGRCPTCGTERYFTSMTEQEKRCSMCPPAVELEPADVSTIKPPRPRTQTLRDRVLDPWSTTRAGDPVLEIEGWGLGLDDPDHPPTTSSPYFDLIELRYQFRRLDPADRDPAWKLSAISPWIPPERRGYWDPASVPISPYMARRQAETAAKKEAYLRVAATGLRARDVMEEVGVKQHTYARWRREDPEWCNRLDAIRTGLEDPLTWNNQSIASRRKYFFGFATYTHQELIIDAIEKAPPGGITLILLPPEAAKTQTVSDYLALRIADDPSLRILYVSEKAGDGSMGQKVLADMKARMTDPHYEDPAATNAHVGEFQARYGPFRDDAEDKDKPWNQNYIKVHKAPAYRDFTFQVAGWRSRLLGNRVDILVFDDVQSGESLTQTEQLLDRIRQTFLTRPGKSGRTIFIGNRIGIGDVYERMIEEGMIDELIVIPALDEDGFSYCPELWPEDALAQRRAKVGEDIWQRTYMMAPQLAEEATYTRELIDACSIDVACGTPALRGLPGSAVVCGLDPALGGGNALVVAAYNADTFRVVDLQLDYRLSRNEEIFERVIDMTRYGFTQLVVEINSQQKGLARDDRLREIAAKHGFEIVEHQTTASGKWDPSWGIRSMAGSFIRGEVQIPNGDDSTRLRLKPLVDQLLAWRPNISPKLQRQDAVMAFWFAWLYWQRERELFGNVGDGWQTRGTPWEPGDMTGRWGRGKRTSRRLAGV